jgi:hypothetical protein
VNAPALAAMDVKEGVLELRLRGDRHIVAALSSAGHCMRGTPKHAIL